ncbi:unnamed protein product [Phytomonas sp. EM1]|nr:unnamed protein product [Phytomonas sp. EM1]|eukprot:CCW62083.1 unnamed protein product [Phytomonas sp. isolate EM1]
MCVLITKNDTVDKKESSSMSNKSGAKHLPSSSNAKAVPKMNMPVKEQDDLDTIFSSISSNKSKTAGAVAGSPNSLNRGKRSNAMKSHSTASINSWKRSREQETLPARQKINLESDGLYRAPIKTLEMSDAMFFESSLPNSKRKVIENLNNSSGNANVLRTEGVHRIVSVSELRKMLSNNPRAGTTPNCPFDCDCCF